ncbi:MAG TPA: GGDEF domain-containing protein, partial [Candidatus Saccharimonadales bacterium]|nr:GGDEF domain-containing protein [Candidatus Saccharimonadales bacterium]
MTSHGPETPYEQPLDPSEHLAAEIAYHRIIEQHLGMIVVTQEQEKQAITSERDEWEKEATTDNLTELPNRLALTRRLEDLVTREPGRFALAFVDLDGLKRINDEQGHQAGNELIINAANVMAESIRTQDASKYPARKHDTEGRAAVRLSGDEFVLIIDNVDDPGQLTQIIDRVQGNLHDADISASIGASLHTPGQTGLQLLEEVDHKMYEQKQDRRRAR